MLEGWTKDEMKHFSHDSWHEPLKSQSKIRIASGVEKTHREARSTVAESSCWELKVDFSRPWKVLWKTAFHLLFLLQNLPIPNGDLGKAEPTFQNAFSKHSSTIRAQIRYSPPLKSASKTNSVGLAFPYQTKMLEGGTRDEMQMFEALFNGVST